MPNEPERPVEKLLRSAARRRRDGAGGAFCLHPATRRLFQGEVARQFPASKAPRSVFSGLWLRMALGTAGACAVLLCLVLILPSASRKKEQLLAKGEATVAEAPTLARVEPPADREKSALEPVMAPTAQPVEAKAKEESLAAASRNRVAMAPYAGLSNESGGQPIVVTAASSAPVDSLRSRPGELPTRADGPAPASEVAAARRYGLAGGAGGLATTPSPGQPRLAGGVRAQPATDEAAISKKLTLASNSDSPVAAAQPAGFAEAPLPGAVAVSPAQHFVRVKTGPLAEAASAATASPSDSVMVSFRLERAGQELRVLDQDGSVYSGQLAVPQVVSGPSQNGAVSLRQVSRTARSAPPALTADKDTQGSMGYSFHVSGTNRSLNQRVVFTGMLVPTNLIASATNIPSPAAAAILPGTQFELPLLNSRLSGKLLIGDTQPVEINAVPAKP